MNKEKNRNHKKINLKLFLELLKDKQIFSYKEDSLNV